MARKPREVESRTLWIKARVRPDELGLIEGRAAQANRTVSEFIRDSALGSIIPAQPLSAVERHDLAQVAVLMKKGDRSNPVLVRLQELIRRIDDVLEAGK
jgi:uncharacterized protein (DUF1778 family)